MLVFFAFLFLAIGLFMIYRYPIMTFIIKHIPKEKKKQPNKSAKVTSAEAKKTIEKNFKGLELLFGRIDIAKIVPMLIAGGVTLWFGSTLLSAINTSAQSSAYNTTALPVLAKTTSGLILPLILASMVIPIIMNLFRKDVF